MMPVPEKCISVSNTKIILGKKVAAFFKSRGITFVNVILNYNNNSLIISDTGLREGLRGSVSYGNHADQGLKIYNLEYNQKTTHIMLAQLKRFLNTDYETVFQAHPFRGNSIIVENLPLKNAVGIRGCVFVLNMKSKLIMFGNFKQCADIKLEDITPSKTDNKIAEEKSATKVTTTPSRPLSPKTIQKNISQPIGDRENTNNDLQEMPVENSASREAIEKADKEYSKLILGE